MGWFVYVVCLNVRDPLMSRGSWFTCFLYLWFSWTFFSSPVCPSYGHLIMELGNFFNWSQGASFEGEYHFLFYILSQCLPKRWVGSLDEKKSGYNCWIISKVTPFSGKPPWPTPNLNRDVPLLHLVLSPTRHQMQVNSWLLHLFW